MKAREGIEHCSGSEWGNETMQRIAREQFAADDTLDIVQVCEHAGWHLSRTRCGLNVGTANDQTVFVRASKQWSGARRVAWRRGMSAMVECKQ